MLHADRPWDWSFEAEEKKRFKGTLVNVATDKQCDDYTNDEE